MAPVPNEGDRGPYAHSTDVNTDPSWRQRADGTPVMGEGVKANLDDLSGFAANIDAIQANFSQLSQTLTGPLNDMAMDAFGGAGNGLQLSIDMLRLAQHNASQIQQFFGNVGMGIRNVAMAAQAVTLAYRGADETSAATLSAVDFAFGDKSKAPPGIPAGVLAQLQTWDQFSAERAGQAAAVPADGSVPPGATVAVSADGKTTTVTTRLPDGQVMTTVTTVAGYRDASGQTQTVYIDGKEQTTRSESTYNGQTQVVQRQTVYDANGNAVRTQITDRTDIRVTHAPDGTQQTDRTNTSYTYDASGKQTDESTSSSRVSVGAENYHEPSQVDDPAMKRQIELMPLPDRDEYVIAPGQTGQPAPPAQPGVA